MEELYSQNFKNYVKGEPDCTEYEGEYLKENRHGNGRANYKDGSVYDGEWRSDLRNGFGLMSFPDESTYEGEWKNSLKHGYGVYVYPNGDKYEGQWYNGQRHGVGTYTHVKDDCSFHGTWNEGQRIGPAEIRNKNFRFHTNWSINKPIGASAFTFNCDTMMTGYMDANISNEKNDSSEDLQWYTQEITKYDRTKLPAEPKIHQFTDVSVDEPLHEANAISVDEIGPDESSKQSDDEDIYANTNIMTPSVQTPINELPIPEVQ